MSQWAIEWTELRSVERLNARGMVAIKRGNDCRDCRRATCFLGSIWGIKPNPEMELMHGSRFRVQVCIRKRRFCVWCRCRCNSRCDSECFVAENTDEIGSAVSIWNRTNVDLIP